MNEREALLLHEEVLLLALHDEKGTVAFGSMSPFAIGGAILAELIVRGRLAIEGEGRKMRVVTRNTTPTGDPVLDECMRRVVEAKRRARPETWIRRLASVRRLRHRIAQRLCERGILAADEKQVLRLFTRMVYPTLDPGPEREVVERLRRAILGDAPDIDARTKVLIALTWSADMLRPIFGGNALRQRRKWLDRIAEENVVGKATKRTIEAVKTAVIVAAG